ncbi:MAG: TerC/Alx family metal homeostasis membrane protein [Ignavibacteria bacterium]|jgi:tellurite resistance protein TerC|nr:TerC/Alx family metal homeostasis membrane protein [Ignavibacteria bacterium]MCU7502687.1 TerC/Alx family metal homeostasis membrane protein [Ignavibacteria bacterium]MCU7515110.1 TerC/Alx family metal homeostasis membrane protein [Ignavibacteria bacterium]
MTTEMIFWAAFVLVFFIVFTVDMFVTDHRKGAISIKQALSWTAVWISVALLYGLAIFLFYPGGSEKATAFVAGYLTEYSLSVDNLFVFIMIFTAMGISQKNQPRMLKIGILLSIFLRILFILFGVGLLHLFHWLIYVFGVVLLFTAYKMAFAGDEEIDPRDNFFYKRVSKYIPIEHDQNSMHFFVRKKGILHATPLFLIFILIGTTDIVFAVDSIPAILGITTESFLVITSNVFAVLGLISLFFALEGIMNIFRFLKQGVAVILLFVGIKMIISGWYQISISFSLLFIVVALSVSILISIMLKPKEEKAIESVK